jgi:hypothetical protein
MQMDGWSDSPQVCKYTLLEKCSSGPCLTYDTFLSRRKALHYCGTKLYIENYSQKNKKYADHKL